jgi:hypothetical protein
MSPTQRARLDREAEAARRAGDLRRLQSIMQQLTMLNDAYYGRPQKTA